MTAKWLKEQKDKMDNPTKENQTERTIRQKGQTYRRTNIQQRKKTLERTKRQNDYRQEGQT